VRRLISRIWNWFRRRSKASTPDASLREFVYLDEVSVYSLTASRRGPITSELTDTESESVRSVLDSTLSVNPGVGGRAGVGSQFERSRTRGTQVVRKSIIQATFKDLLDFETESMQLRDGLGPDGLPDIQTLDELRQLDVTEQGRHLISAKSLSRGQLLELEVELDAEAVFRASRVMSTAFAFFDQIPELFPSGPGDLAQARAANQMFEQMLAGLVPIRGEATNYKYIELDGEGLLISRSILRKLGGLREVDPQPIHVVGVAEADLFWRDLRRVLFSRSKYFVMFRLNGDGLTDSWKPVKLADVLESVIPNLASLIEQAGQSFLEGAAQGAASQLEGRDESGDKALLDFATAAASKVGIQWSSENSTEMNLSEIDPDFTTVESQRETFAPIISYLEEGSGQTIDPADAAELRHQILVANGHLPDFADGQPMVGETLIEPSDPEHLLDSEIVAIYW
jgi:hypothetical protein